MNQAVDEVIFRESQKFGRFSLWMTAGITIIGLAIVAIYLGIRQFGLIDATSGQVQHTIPAWAVVLLVAIFVGVAWLMHASRLVTEVRSSGLYIQFFPFHFSFRRIDLHDLTGVEAKEYRPLMDYGGWGIRSGSAGKAYNVSGNRGVKLNFRSSTSLLIGSQRAEDLAQAIGVLIKGHK